MYRDIVLVTVSTCGGDTDSLCRPEVVDSVSQGIAGIAQRKIYCVSVWEREIEKEFRNNAVR